MKPFITYIGSKRFLLKSIKLPKTINNYYEPFVGGGSMLYHVNNNYDIKKNYINDLNKDIINIYKVIKSNSTKLLIELYRLNKLRGIPVFNEIVNTFNNSSNKILKSAIHIYLSKICFNSTLNYQGSIIKPQYSEQRRNQIKNIHKDKNIKDISKLLKKTIIKSQDYKTFLNKNKPKKGDFVFLDPPYLVKDVKKYYKDVFNLKNFEELKKKM